jgi:hypothetical protein
MAEFILSEKQIEAIKNNIEFNNKLSIAQENWERMTDKEKEFVIETSKLIYPYDSKLIKEAKWYNTLGDIIGIFDPTGVVDLVNGVSYINQGDNLFGFLSMVSALPYLGDLVAKPVMGALKIGAPSAKGLKEVLALSKAGKSVEAADMLTKLTKSEGLVGKFVKGMEKIAPKFKDVIQRMPNGPLKGLKNTLLGWIELFEKGAVAGSKVRKSGANIARLMTGNVRLSRKSQQELLKGLIKASKESGFFKTFRTSNKLLSSKTFWGGMPQLIGRNKSVRALMRRTKFWAGFLDWLGLGNFVGPDELIKKMGEGEFGRKMAEYQKTPESQQYYKDDFGSEVYQDEVDTASQSQTTQTTDSDSSPIKSFISSLFTGQLKNAALAAI